MSDLPYSCDPDNLPSSPVNLTNIEALTVGELRALIEQLNIALYTRLIKSKE